MSSNPCVFSRFFSFLLLPPLLLNAFKRGEFPLTPEKEEEEEVPENDEDEDVEDKWDNKWDDMSDSEIDSDMYALACRK